VELVAHERIPDQARVPNDYVVVGVDRLTLDSRPHAASVNPATTTSASTCVTDHQAPIVEIPWLANIDINHKRALRVKAGSNAGHSTVFEEFEALCQMLTQVSIQAS
jgi:hypothetical protein